MGFFSSLANTGFQPFYQKKVPSSKMGRIGATLGMFQNAALILGILLAGYLSEAYSVRYTVVGISLLILFVALGLNVYVLLSKQVNDKKLLMEVKETI